MFSLFDDFSFKQQLSLWCIIYVDQGQDQLYIDRGQDQVSRLQPIRRAVDDRNSANYNNYTYY